MATADIDVEYRTSLEDLTFNSKPHINALTMLAEEYQDEAHVIVRVIEEKLDKALPNCKLPLMYLMDSIVKNVGGNYKPLFAKHIVKSFMSTFHKGDEKIKLSLYKLRSTWDNYLPLKRLYELDVAVQALDANWPVKPLPASLQEKSSTNIHVNPKFLKTESLPISGTTSRITSSKTTRSLGVTDSTDLKQDLINKQKQLLELQQQKLLLELEQTKQQLALREKKTLDKKQGKVVAKDPRVKQASLARPGMRGSAINGLVESRDPRVALSSTKAKIDAKKALVELSRKPVDAKKLEEPKSVEKKIPLANSEKIEKRKKSPNSYNKTAVSKASKQSPKSPKSDLVAKKTVPKKNIGKAVKRNSQENRSDESLLKPAVKNESGKSKSNKIKDKPIRRSPSRARPPLAKQPRRSSSIERRHSPDREMNNAAERARGRSFPQKNAKHRRFSPTSGEGSMSPRFSPEPDESPRRNNSGPAKKRPRHQNFPPHPEPAHMPPSHEPPRFRRRASVDPNLTIPRELSLSHQAEIMKQADIQLQTGQLTHTQHQELLKQLHQLFQLQRLRNSVGPGPAMHGMPLDELLPPLPEPIAHNDELGPPMHFQEEFAQNFRPPPSPPMMGDDPHSAHPIREHNLTPPPNPPIDPRRNRNRPGDKRSMRDYHDPRSRIRNDPGRRPSPPHRQRNAGWDENKVLHRNDIGTDMGNVYIVEDDRDMHVSQGPRDKDYHEGDQNVHDLNNGTRPSNRVPLRAYADNNTSHVRRPSFDSSSPPDNHDDAIKDHSVPQAKADSDNEYDGPQFEEPEDYIIANIPPGAEAYHEHSMKLKRGNKVSASMIANRKLSDAGEAGKEQELGNDKMAPVENHDAIPMSPESSRDKLEDVEDLTKSPSLPLKKRKYVVSPGRVDDPDTANEQEAEAHVKRKDSSDASQSQNRIPEVEHHSEIIEDKSKTEDKTDDTHFVESVKTDGDKAEKLSDDKSGTDGKEGEMTKEAAVIKVEKNLDESKDAAAGTSEHIRSGKSVQPSESERVSEEKERIRPLLSEPNNERINKKKRKRDKARERKAAQAQPPPRRHPPEEHIARMEEERRLNQLMMEEEERQRWEAQLEMELGREEFQERERMGRAMRGSPPRMMWPRDDGPWRGRGGRPPPGRGRRFEREFWDNEPPPRFADRPPLNRPPPPRRLIDEREWDRYEEQRHGRHQMHRPPPGRDWPPRGPPRAASPKRLLPPERSQPPADLNQVNVNKLLSDLLSMGIIPGQGKAEDAEKSADTPVETKNSPEVPDSHRTEPTNVPLLVKNEKKLEENRVPTPVFDDLLTIDPNASLPDLELRDTEKLKIRNEDVVARLYTGIQCSACGMRFTACQTDMYAEHLDWHYRLNRKDKEGMRETHRELYPTAGEWIMYEEVVDPSRREKSQVFDGEVEEDEEEAAAEAKNENELAVPVAKNPEQDKCAVCNEAFTTIYNDEEEEWQYIGCVAVDGKNFHPACYADHNDPDDETAPPPPTPVRVPIYNPLSVAASGIPGLDSLTKEASNDEETEDVEMKNVEANGEGSTIDSKHELDTDVAIDVQPSELQDDSQAHAEDTQAHAKDTSQPNDLEGDGDNEGKETSIDDNQNDHVVEMKDIEEEQDIEAQDIAEKIPSSVQDDSAVDNGIKSVDSPKTQILDQVESHSPLTSAADDANEVSIVSKKVDAPVYDNDSVSLQVESSSSPDAVDGESCRDAVRSNVESEVSGPTVEQQHEPQALESEVDDLPSAENSAGNSP